MSIPPFGAKDVLRITMLYISIISSGKEIDSSEYILSGFLRKGGREGGSERVSEEKKMNWSDSISIWLYPS